MLMNIILLTIFLIMIVQMQRYHTGMNYPPGVREGYLLEGMIQSMKHRDLDILLTGEMMIICPSQLLPLMLLYTLVTYQGMLTRLLVIQSGRKPWRKRYLL